MPDELHFVLQHQRYRYQYAPLLVALHRQLGHAGELPAAKSDAERVRRERRLAELLQIRWRSRHFESYAAALRDRVEVAVHERARRLSSAQGRVPP